GLPYSDWPWTIAGSALRARDAKRILLVGHFRRETIHRRKNFSRPVVTIVYSSGALGQKISNRFPTQSSFSCDCRSNCLQTSGGAGVGPRLPPGLCVFGACRRRGGGERAARRAGLCDSRHGDRAVLRHRPQPVGAAASFPAGDRVFSQDAAALGGG